MIKYEDIKASVKEPLSFLELLAKEINANLEDDGWLTPNAQTIKITPEEYAALEIKSCKQWHSYRLRLRKEWKAAVKNECLKSGFPEEKFNKAFDYLLDKVEDVDYLADEILKVWKMFK